MKLNYNLNKIIYFLKVNQFILKLSFTSKFNYIILIQLKKKNIFLTKFFFIKPIHLMRHISIVSNYF
jgi:hypothetical protein